MKTITLEMEPLLAASMRHAMRQRVKRIQYGLCVYKPVGDTKAKFDEELKQLNKALASLNSQLATIDMRRTWCMVKKLSTTSRKEGTNEEVNFNHDGISFVDGLYS